MIHKKSEHPEKVQLCTNISEEGLCIFGSGCWFNHEVNHDSVCDYNCNFCEKTFMTKTELMKHKSSKHRGNVQDCKNYIEYSCPMKMIEEQTEKINTLESKEKWKNLYA